MRRRYIRNAGATWLNHDDAVLLRNVKEGMPILLIALVLGRSEQAVRARLRKLKLKNPGVA